MRVMAFVDGENLAMRFKAMQKAGRELKPGLDLRHEPNVYVWKEGGSFTYELRTYKVLRCILYTSAVGDDKKLDSIRAEIRKLGMSGAGRVSLYPVVLKKDKSEAKAKGVDIQLCVDVLCHAHGANADLIWLFTGDGDFVPLIREVIRSGRTVWLSAFSSGLNPELPYVVDRFFSLDEEFFSP